jgi:hypothetical protein
VLVTLDNLADRGQYLNAQNTFRALLGYGVIPVVNENVRHGESRVWMDRQWARMRPERRKRGSREGGRVGA